MNAHSSLRAARPSLTLPLAVAAVALACGQGAQTLTAGVDGAHDLALVNGLLFVTATDDNELRVVDLELDRPNFIRGPNPLHPLSIPVAVRPVELAGDQGYGAEDVARFVYARSATGTEISIVSAQRDAGAGGLRELGAPGEEGVFVPLRQRAADGEVITAMAARAGASGSILYYAVARGGGAAIRKVEVSAGNLAEDASDLVTETCGAITSLLTLPDPNLLAFSVRRPRGAFEACTDPGAAEADRLSALDTLSEETAFIVDLGSGVRRVLAFGAPIRDLYTHASYGPEGVVAAGTFIFGLIDEDACWRPDCRGVLAVDAATGALAPVVRDGAPVGPMRPITAGNALPMDLALGENVVVGGGLQTSLVGALTGGDGRVYLFDAVAMEAPDTNPEPAAPVRTGEVLAVERIPDAGGDLTVSFLSDFAARDEEIRVVYRAAPPGLSEIPVPLAATTVDVPVDPTVGAQVGDVVEAQEGCGAGATVTAVERRSVLGGRLTFSAPVGGEGCRLTVRPPAGGADWVVVGSSSGYLGRLSPGTEAQLPEDAARREALHHRAPGGPAPALLHLTLTAPSQVEVGQTLRFRTVSGYAPFSVGPSTEVDRQLQNRLGVAGAARFRPGANRLLVAYPSGDVVLQTYPEEFRPGAAVSRVDAFR